VKMFWINPFRASTGLDRPDPQGFVRVGEPGRGRREVLVPTSGDGDFVRVGLDPEGRPVLCRTHEDDGDRRCVAVISTNGGYSQYPKRHYRMPDPVPAGVRILASGEGAWGDAGYGGDYEVVLAIVEPGAEFVLARRFGGPVLVRWTGERWLHLDEAAVEAEKAAASMEKGEVQWL